MPEEAVIPGAEPVSVAGDDVGVLVLHGFTGNPGSIRPLADALAADGRTVEAPRLPGHGTAMEDMVETRWVDWSAAAEAGYAELAGRTRTTVVAGLSMGGTLACWLAARHPEVAGLVAVNPLVQPADPEMVAMGRAMLDAGETIAPGIGSDIADPGASETAYPGSPLLALLSLVEAVEALQPELSRIACPVLLMTSPEDHVVPPANSDHLAAVVAGPVERVALERSYHVATLDFDKDLIAERAVAFVRKVTRRVVAVLSRRQFLAALAASAVVGACSDDSSDGGGSGSASSARGSTSTTGPLPRLDGPAFTLGVASGDPTADSVILWTRLATDPVNGGGMPDADLPVVWELASDERIGDVVASGVATASPRLGHSVHVDATGLDPARTYWYRFRVGDEESPVGRTRTAPAEDATPERLRLAFASCSHWQDGYWTAYPHLAEEDLDLVVFLGDYIYEGNPDPAAPRVHNSPRVQTLEGYRNRYGLYKGDAGLQAVHAAFPWISTWDDHEVANDYGGDFDPLGAPPEDFLQRRAAAYQAWYEHLPIRLEPPTSPDYRIYRTVPYGRLAAFHLLDERQYRSAPVCDAEIGPVCEEAEDPARTVLGEAQEGWLADQLDSSPATWDVLANSVVLSKTAIPLGDQVLFNLDQWDGYPPARQRMLDLLAERRDGNRVVLTGDLHAGGVGDLLADFEDERSAVIGSEFLGTSVSSDFEEALIDIAEQAVRQAPWIRYFEARHRGYVTVEATPDALQADYRLVASVDEPQSTIETAASWAVEAGNPGAQEA